MGHAIAEWEDALKRLAKRGDWNSVMESIRLQADVQTSYQHAHLNADEVIFIRRFVPHIITYDAAESITGAGPHPLQDAKARETWSWVPEWVEENIPAQCLQIDSDVLRELADDLQAATK